MSILINLVAERQSPHPTLDPKDIVVNCEQMHVGVGLACLLLDLHLSVVDAREVAGTRWLVLLGLKGEGV